eukprot:UC4_evm9s379
MLLLSLVLAITSKPNVLFLLTDDQDLVLGSMDPDGPMQKTRKLVIEKGVWAEIQTGRYMHNTKVYGNDCGGQDFIDGPEKLNVGFYAKLHGYTTFYAGKYLNNYGSPKVGGLSRIPPGWDQWYGLEGNSKTLEFLANATKNRDVPFFAMMGTPACHGPNDPAPQYLQTYAGRSSPRTPSWNKAPQPNKHWLLRQIVPMDEAHANTSDIYFARRWSVLRSVDDMVEKLFAFLRERNVLDNTFFLYTGDHGYHLGQFGMLYDKRMLYETDIRTPLFAFGPGIPAGLIVNESAVHVDLAPTILDMMGIPTPEQMDGRSWLALAQNRSDKPAPRNKFMVEYSGGGQPEWAEAQDDDGIFYTPGCTNVDKSNEALLGCHVSCTVGALSGVVMDISPCDGRNNS